MSASGVGLAREVLEERRLADVGRVGFPREVVAGGHRQLLPALVALEDARVLLLEHLGGHRAAAPPAALRARSARCPSGRPACRPCRSPSGSVGDIDVHRSGQRVGHHQRRRGQVVGAHVLLDPALEVAVAAQHRRDDEAALAHLGADLVGQRTAVADARRAAVADEVEAELVEIRLQAGLGEVLGDDLRARAPGWSSPTACW